MGEDFLRSCFKDLGDDIHQMVHSIAVHYNPLRPRQLMKGHAFITFQNPAAASSALTSIINGTWANNSDDPLCLAKVSSFSYLCAASKQTVQSQGVAFVDGILFINEIFVLSIYLESNCMHCLHCYKALPTMTTWMVCRQG